MPRVYNFYGLVLSTKEDKKKKKKKEHIMGSQTSTERPYGLGSFTKWNGNSKF